MFDGENISTLLSVLVDDCSDRAVSPLFILVLCYTTSMAQLYVQAIASVDRQEMFVEHMKERERRKRAEEKAARKRKMQDFKELLERSSGIKVMPMFYAARYLLHRLLTCT